MRAKRKTFAESQQNEGAKEATAMVVSYLESLEPMVLFTMRPAMPRPIGIGGGH